MMKKAKDSCRWSMSNDGNSWTTNPPHRFCHTVERSRPACRLPLDHMNMKGNASLWPHRSSLIIWFLMRLQSYADYLRSIAVTTAPRFPGLVPRSSGEILLDLSWQNLPFSGNGDAKTFARLVNSLSVSPILLYPLYLCSLGEGADIQIGLVLRQNNVVMQWFRLKILLVLCKSHIGDQRRVTSLSSWFIWIGLASIQVLWWRLLNSCVSLLLSKTKAKTKACSEFYDQDSFFVAISIRFSVIMLRCYVVLRCTL